ncbi:MAG: Bug family tripartite tricarboxylate transporter substrate binding protein [Betaproteobacteria bacterium]
MRKVVAAMLIALAPSLAAAQAYPAKAVHIINPFTAGGPVDLLARAVGQKLHETWGQPVVVETRAGAAGNIGIEYVARQPADGYTLLVMPTGNAVVNPHIYPKLPYDPLKDFAPVTLLATVENVLVVHPSVKAGSVQELIALARANPGKLSFPSPGVGSQAHVAGEMLQSMANVKMLHVPYKGMAPAMNDLLGGQVSFMFLSISSALKQVEAGKLRALGVASLQRSSAAPNLPTVAEQGLPGFEAVSWYALMAPTGTPKEVVDKIAADSARALKAPDVRDRLVGLGANPVGNTPAELGQMLKKEHAFWGDFIRKAGIKAE